MTPSDRLAAEHARNLGRNNMYAMPNWNVDATSILTRRELAVVLVDLKAKSSKLTNARRNLVIFRLACCCGLRVSEIAQLCLNDVVLDTPRPHLSLRAPTTKGKRPRRVPLWWDAGTLADLTAWKELRRTQGAGGDDPFVCSVQAHLRGEALQRAAIRRRFLSACKVLGLGRLRTLTVHHGRHTFISHALAGGRTLAEVRIAAGHTNLVVTSIYLHVAVDDDDGVGDLFAPR
jgi:integrase